MPYYDSKKEVWRGTKMIDGVRKTKSFRTKKAAKAWEASVQEIQAQVQEEESQEALEPETGTVCCLIDAASAYLDYSQLRHHPATYAAKKLSLQRLLRLVNPKAGPEAVTPKIALELIMSRERECSAAAANKDRKHLAAWWTHCSRFFDFPKENPFLLCDKLPEDSSPHYVPPIEDFWKVYAVADENDKVLLLSLLYTAGRRSEPFRWTWDEDIDLTNRRIRLSTCKTKDGSRKYEWMTLPTRLYDALCNYKALQTSKSQSRDNHVFLAPDGAPYKQRKHFITRLCKRAGIKPFNYHGIRGLCATMLAAGGANLKDIQGILMHSNITVTDRYIRRLGGLSNTLLSAFEAFDETEKKIPLKVRSFKG